MDSLNGRDKRDGTGQVDFVPLTGPAVGTSEAGRDGTPPLRGVPLSRCPGEPSRELMEELGLVTKHGDNQHRRSSQSEKSFATKTAEELGVSAPMKEGRQPDDYPTDDWRGVRRRRAAKPKSTRRRKKRDRANPADAILTARYPRATEQRLEAVAERMMATKSVCAVFAVELGLTLLESALPEDLGNVSPAELVARASGSPRTP